MRYPAIAFLSLSLTAGALFAQTPPAASPPASSGAGATSLANSTNLPIEQIGPNDLLGITVYDSPELTRSVRVDSHGTIRLPMMKEHIKAAGLYPEDLENAIAAALVDNEILVDPIVSVSVIEYRSRPISIVGAVRSPITFQDTGVVTLLDAITQAGGLTETAGENILVSHHELDQDGTPTIALRQISTQDLLSGADPSLNIILHSGDLVRVPDAGRFYVVGNVKNPGAYTIKDGAASSILKAMAVSQGLTPYSTKTAYIYRVVNGSGMRTEIPVPLNDILHRKAPDEPLMANDIFYVPEATTRKNVMTALNRTALIAVGFGNALLYIYH